MLCSIIVHGFIPTNLTEVGFRAPSGPVQTISGTVRAWPDVRALLGEPKAPGTAARTMNALLVKG